VDIKDILKKIRLIILKNNNIEIKDIEKYKFKDNNTEDMAYIVHVRRRQLQEGYTPCFSSEDSKFISLYDIDNKVSKHMCIPCCYSDNCSRTY